MSSEFTTFGLVEPFSFARGYVDLAPVANPAAGAASVTLLVVPGGERWRMRTVAFQLVTDANAGNRQPILDWQDGDGVSYARLGPAQAQAAAQTFRHSFLVNIGVNAAVAALAQSVSAPSLIMLSSHRLVLTIVNVQVGDQLSLIRVYFERLLHGADGYPRGVQAKTLETTLLEE